ncbi:hypothetical protein [Metabacillus sp. Hm71]
MSTTKSRKGMNIFFILIFSFNNSVVG